PDLETFQYKRSYVRKDIEYVYIFHGMFSGLVTLRRGALDHFDTLLTPTPGFEEEMRAWNRENGLRDQRMVPCGYGVIDNMAAEYEAMEKKEHDPKTILIAPSWQEGNILDSCLAELTEPLLAEGYDVTVRPHPQYIRRRPQRLESLMDRCRAYPQERFRFQLDFGSNETVFSSDLVVTDWSNIGYEFAVATKKPVLFVNTPRKVVNEAWPLENVRKYAPDDGIREIIGMTIDPPDVRERGPGAVRYMLERRAEYGQILETVRRERLYHFGESGKYGAQYLIERMLEKQKNGNSH
ncbi:MAG: CDP-glycerol glycerophosphotransferase family protein, partial [Oscillospiraceae bacterium]|nr:CDP-glycerol glycerophosphotransferase family protein [Oscillospiraceae bacterium]